MDVPCVQVEREDGEATRQALADEDLVNQEHKIVHDDGWLYIPVTDPAAVPVSHEVVDHAVPERKTQTMPDDLVDFVASYERLGEVVLIDEDDDARARALADAIVESDIPMKSVLNRASKIQGETRIRDWDVLAGADTEAVHREYGCAFALDLAAVYFSPRLATERHRVVEQVQSEERIFDMFAGVGPFVIPCAKQGAEVVGTDINATAINYLHENAERNSVAERVTATHDDVRVIATDYEGWADRLVMNLPHSADEFLDTAKRLASEECMLHYYDIQHEDAPFEPGIQRIREIMEPEYAVDIETKHVVRSYAPHEDNVVLDVRLLRD
ncbi:class I SAM-dependent methyltransferase [Halovenus rubra]|uniref:Class I SAM-dependent methyltransferase n=2 Tax=Halovenus rubra TaxID=869890 RepID=A0ACC7DXJ4_9EURY|nr:class I SAM-dependent methyltransferase family protein [Halovenus rubra]